MAEGQAALTPVLAQLADDLASRVAKRYRVTHEQALATILEEWSGQTALLRMADQASRPEDLERTRVYRDAADAVKREIYYQLRRYRSQDDEADEALQTLSRMQTGTSVDEQDAAVAAVARQHISTAERIPHLDEFFTNLLKLTGVPETVLDVGCGVLPLVVPWDGSMSTTRSYWALDKDPIAVAATREYARVRGDHRLHSVRWDLADGWAAAHAAGLPDSVEVAFLLKVVPVVARQSTALLTTLAQTPAEKLVVSGSRVAMAKRQDIERRETRVLEKFFVDYGFSVRGRFRMQDEFAFLVDRG